MTPTEGQQRPPAGGTRLPPLKPRKQRSAADKHRRRRAKKAKRAPARERSPAKASPYDERVKQAHGGALLRGGVRGNRGGGRPIEHGLRLEVQHSDLGQLIEEYSYDPNALTIYAELATARALFTDYVNRFTTWRDALFAWHLNGKKTAPPDHVMEISGARELLSEITKIWKRIMDVRSANAISRRDLYRILAEMGRAVDRHVRDKESRKKICDDWLAIPMG